MAEILPPEPGYVIHADPYKEHSLLVEIFTLHYGRVSAVANSLKNRRLKLRSLLKPFNPLTITLVRGRSSLWGISDCELSGSVPAFGMPQIFCASYLNELIFHLIKTPQSEPRLFAAYITALRQLAEVQEQADAAYPQGKTSLSADNTALNRAGIKPGGHLEVQSSGGSEDNDSTALSVPQADLNLQTSAKNRTGTDARKPEPAGGSQCSRPADDLKTGLSPDGSTFIPQSAPSSGPKQPVPELKLPSEPDGLDTGTILLTFERVLLESIGYAIEYRDPDGDEFIPDKCYSYLPQRGFFPVEYPDQECFCGNTLNQLARGDYAGAEAKAAAKIIHFRTIAKLLDYRSLESRRLYKSYLLQVGSHSHG